MKVKMRYPINIEEWKHESWEKFLVPISCTLSQKVSLTNPDLFNRVFNFNVGTHLSYTNPQNEQVFSGMAVSTFQIGFEKNAPTVQFLFNLVDLATFEFAKVFHEKTQATNLVHHKIPKPKLETFEKTLRDAIDVWDAPAQEFIEQGRVHLMKFKDLPKIPEMKRYNPETHITQEQMISHKLHFKKFVNEKERVAFEGLSNYYKELDEKLKSLNYSLFTPDDFKNFKNYILHCFNFIAFISTPLTIFNVFRLIVNERVTEHNEPITEVKYLSYPNEDIVKKKGIYNRANTVNSTVMYVTENIDTAIKEIRPPVNKLITIGIWSPNKNKNFTTYPIVHDNEAISVNKNVLEASRHIQEIEKEYDPLFLKYVRYYFNLLSREFSKPVTDSFEYILSAIFAEKIFEYQSDNPDFNFECIIYPSVGNDLMTRNIAIKPTVVDADFKLSKAIEFEIVESLYDRKAIDTGNPESISLAKIKNYRVTQNITSSGEIIW